MVIITPKQFWIKSRPLFLPGDQGCSATNIVVETPFPLHPWSRLRPKSNTKYCSGWRPVMLDQMCASSEEPDPLRETGCDSAQLCWSSGSSFPYICHFDLNLFIQQSRGNDSITLRFFQCPGVFAIAMFLFLCLKFPIFAKWIQLRKQWVNHNHMSDSES